MPKSKQEYLKVLPSGTVEVRRGHDLLKSSTGLTVQAFLHLLFDQAKHQDVARVMVHSRSENKLHIEFDPEAPKFITFWISGTSQDGDWNYPFTISLDNQMSVLSALLLYVGGARGRFTRKELKVIRQTLEGFEQET